MSIADTIEDTFAARNPATMAAAIVGGVVLAIPDGTDPQTVTTRMTGGVVAPAVEWDGKLWSLDPDDSTTDHDEITCIRTIDNDGYFTNDLTFPPAVLSRAVATPPDPDDVVPEDRPAYGDQYLVPAGATDDWAGHEDERTRWSARGWQFKAGAHGETVLVEDEGETGEYIHFNADDEWEDGLPGNLIALSVRPSALLIRSWSVENQTVTAWPATGPAGEQYVVGSSATGALSGQDKKIAWRPFTDAAPVITTPFVGEEIYDKATGNRYRWSGTAWVSAAGALLGILSTGFLIPAVNPASTGSFAFSKAVYLGGTIYTTNYYGVAMPETLTYAAKKAGNLLRFTLEARVTSTSDDGIPFGIFVDSVVNAVDWRHEPEFTPTVDLVRGTMYHTVPDDDEHVYKLRFGVTTSGNGVTAIACRILTVEEFEQ